MRENGIPHKVMDTALCTDVFSALESNAFHLHGERGTRSIPQPSRLKLSIERPETQGILEPRQYYATVQLYIPQTYFDEHGKQLVKNSRLKRSLHQVQLDQFSRRCIQLHLLLCKSLLIALTNLNPLDPSPLQQSIPRKPKPSRGN